MTADLQWPYLQFFSKYFFLDLLVSHLNAHSLGWFSEVFSQSSWEQSSVLHSSQYSFFYHHHLRITSQPTKDKSLWQKWWQQFPRLTCPRGSSAGCQLFCAVGSEGVFSHRVIQSLGHPRECSCCRNTEWSWRFQWLLCWEDSGLGWLLSSRAISQHHQVCVPNPACTAKDPFQKGWNVSDNTTAAVSLLHFCVESPLTKYH